MTESNPQIRASGYLEDPATGIAAAVLTFGLLLSQLLDSQRTVGIRQGWGSSNNQIGELAVE